MRVLVQPREELRAVRRLALVEDLLLDLLRAAPLLRLVDEIEGGHERGHHDEQSRELHL